MFQLGDRVQVRMDANWPKWQLGKTGTVVRIEPGSTLPVRIQYDESHKDRHGGVYSYNVYHWDDLELLAHASILEDTRDYLTAITEL